MKFLFILSAFLVQWATNEAATHIWPEPTKIVAQNYWLETTPTQLKFVDKSMIRCSTINIAIDRFRDRMFTKNCQKLNSKLELAKTTIPFTPRIHKSHGELNSLVIESTGKCEEYPHMNMDESYDLVVENTTATLKSKSVWGILRGLETFSQLLEIVAEDVYQVPVVTIHDKPRFSHRGLLIDSSRHFLSMQSIYDTLDAMEMNKMNVLHWHIVDDQSFPYVSDKFPQMSQKGAFHPVTHVYTKKNVDDIIEYGRLRGIRILTEFDTPGHVRSWGNSISGLLTTCYDAKGNPNGHFGPIDPIKFSTYDFIKEFFHEITQRFPDQYLHLGGDEVPFDCWQSNPDIQKFMAKQNIKKFEDLESYYIQKLLDIVQGLNHSYIVWQEVFDNGVKLAPETVVHVWKGHDIEWQNEMARIVKDNHFRVLLSSPWYLNYISYGSDWQKYYMVEPLNFNATAAQKELVLGGEACMWGEWVDSSNLVALTWPRASAVAERLWSRPEVNNLQSARSRLMRQGCRMQRLGLRVEPITGPGHCECDYAL